MANVFATAVCDVHHAGWRALGGLGFIGFFGQEGRRNWLLMQGPGS